MRTYQIGVIADTHVPDLLATLPDEITALLQNVDLIIHLGNITGSDTLRDLGKLAPVIAVRGHDDTLPLPKETILSIGGLRLALTHGSALPMQNLQGTIAGKLNNGRTEARQRFLDHLLHALPGADAILFAHGNRPYMAWHGATLLFSPGAVCHRPNTGNADMPATVGLLTICDGKIQAEMRSILAPVAPSAVA
jgi:uncharacterized protein